MEGALAVEIASPESACVRAGEERQCMRSQRTGRVEVEQDASDARPDQPRAHTLRPRKPDHCDEDQVRKRTCDLELGGPGDLDECSAQHQEQAGHHFHEGVKSVTTMTRLSVAGSLAQSTSAVSKVAASLWVTLVTSPTTRPRG